MNGSQRVPAVDDRTELPFIETPFATGVTLYDVIAIYGGYELPPFRHEQDCTAAGFATHPHERETGVPNELSYLTAKVGNIGIRIVIVTTVPARMP